MNQHFLDRMFAGESSAFLDQVVDVDEDTAVHREDAAEEQGEKDRTAADRRAGTPKSKERTGTGTPGTLGASSIVGVVRGEMPGSHGGGTAPDYGSECKRSFQAQRGKTVRDLSRLWRYKGGNEPKD